MILLVIALSFLIALPSPQMPEANAGFGVLGIEGDALPEGAGVKVIGFNPQSPAEAAGVRIGDVVQTIDGWPVESYEELMDAVQAAPLGQRLLLRIQRNMEEREIQVTLADARLLCESGNGWACGVMGYRLQVRASLDSNNGRQAAEFYGRACELGYVPGCTNLGVMYLLGNSVPEDPAQSAALFERACNSDQAYACLSLAEAHQDGEGVEQDISLALKLYEKACELGEAYACYVLGSMFQNGRDVERDWTIAAKYHELACQGGWVNACPEWWYVSRHEPPDRREPKTFPNATPQLNAALVEATAAGGIDEVRQLLDEGADPNTRGDWGSMRDVRLVKIAIYAKHPEIVRLLIEAGVDIEGKDSGNLATPLTAAIGQGELKTVEVLLQLGAKVRNGDLGAAAGYGSPEMMRRLMEEGIATDDLYLDMMPPVKHAAEMKRFDNIDFLLEHGADIDALDTNDNHSALTYAVDQGETDVVTFLLSRGADPSRLDNNGKTGLHYAAENGSIELLRLLLEAGAGPDVTGRKMMSPLTTAAAIGQTEAVRLLLEHGAIPGTDENAISPLMYAAAMGYYEIVRLLVDAGANVNHMIMDEQMQTHTALSVAVQAGHQDIADLLRDAGAKEP